MSITRVQYVSNASTGSGTTSLTTTIAAATAGNLLVALIATGATTSAGTTTTPTGFTALAFNPVTNTSANPAPVNIYLFYKISTGGETSVVATNTVTSGVTCQVWEFSASTGWPANPVDVSASSSNQAATTTPVTGTTATTGQAEEVWIASVSTNSGTQITYSLPVNGFTQETTAWAGASPFFSPNTAGLYKIVSATATASSGVTSSISKGFGGFVVAFKDNPASGGGSLVANAVLSEPAAQVVTTGNALASNSVLSEPAAVVVASGQIMQSNAVMTVAARVVAGASPLIANSALVSPSAQIVAPATVASSSVLAQLAAQLVARGDALVANAILAGTGSSTGGGSSTGASLHGTTVVRPSGEVGLSVARMAENGLTGVRGYLQGSSVVRPSESALSDAVRASLTGATVIRGG